MSCQLNICGLLIDFKVLAPLSIDYKRALEYLGGRFGEIVKNGSSNVFTQIDLVKEKASKSEFDEFSSRMTSLLDEIETQQIDQFKLNMGVKNGLATLNSLDVTVVALTDLGAKAAEKFLKENEIDSFFGKLVASDKLGEPFDLGSRLNKSLGSHDLKQEECVYLCNKLTDLKIAKASNFRTIALPSKGEKLDLMMLENPLGMIMSLEEVPNLISLEVARSAKPKQNQIPEESEKEDMRA